MYEVTAKVKTNDPCPKREYRAWDFETGEFPTLTECICFLLERDTCGFTIKKDGESIADHTLYE